MYVVKRSPVSIIFREFFCCKAISYAVGFVSRRGLFRLKPQWGFLTRSKQGFFDSSFFDWEFRLADPVEKLDFFDWIFQSKNSVEKVLHVFF